MKINLVSRLNHKLMLALFLHGVANHEASDEVPEEFSCARKEKTRRNGLTQTGA